MQSGYVYLEEYHNSIRFDLTSAGKVACRILDVQLDNMEATASKLSRASLQQDHGYTNLKFCFFNDS